MIIKKDKNADRVIRHARVRKKVSGTAERPRLNVYRSTNHIYAQVIDDVKGVTLCSASTMEKEIAAQVAGLNKCDAAKVVEWNHSRGVIHALHPVREDRLDVDKEGFLQAFHALLDVFYRIFHRIHRYAAFSPRWLGSPRSPSREGCEAR